MCLTAWNEPIGLPNWTRSLAYSTDIDSTWSAAPSISAETRVAARSSARAAASAPPRRTAGVPSKARTPEFARAVHGGHRVGSARSAQVDRVDVPSSQTTTATSAEGAYVAGGASPWSSTSPSVGASETEMRPGGAKTAQPTAAPWLSASRHSFAAARRRWRRNRSTHRAPRPRGGTARRRGDARSPRRARRPRPVPSPSPPSSSGSSMASQPCSAMASQAAAS